MLMAMVTDGLFEAFESTAVRIELDEIVVEIENEIEVEVELEGG